jgi:hypothetical protein
MKGLTMPDLLTVADEVDNPHQLLSRCQKWTEEADEEARGLLDEIIADASHGDFSSMTVSRLQTLGNLAYVCLELMEMKIVSQRQTRIINLN